MSSPTRRARPLPEQTPGRRPPLVRRLSAHRLSAHRLLAHPGVGALAVLTAAFLAIALPPYLTLDPARSRSRGPADFPAYYPLLVTHIFLGAIVLVTACLQVWPWLRRRHPRVHRWAGRGYVGAVLAASSCVLVIAPLGSFGPNEHVALTLLGLLWPATTIAGHRMARRRRFAEHREWMIRGVALSFSIVTNRAWAALCVPLFVPDSLPVGGTEWRAALAQAMGVAFWLCWVVNLLVAEWWIQRSRRLTGSVAGRSAGGRAERG
ncbi:MAG TPA: DUF2306 domain-containing protein [Pseudonocardia sp.]|nr:DUF2306 domain-containing protein [Pseudonocardia sp.]